MLGAAADAPWTVGGDKALPTSSLTEDWREKETGVLAPLSLLFLTELLLAFLSSLA